MVKDEAFCIRSAVALDAPGITAVHVRAWQETYAGILSEEYLTSISYTKRLAGWQQFIEKMPGSATLLTVEERATNRIIGFCALAEPRLFKGRFEAEIQAIYLLKEFQGLGLGRALFSEAIRHMSLAKKHSFYLGVLEKNRSIGFYEKLNGERLPLEQDVNIDGSILKEVFYGWKTSV